MHYTSDLDTFADAIVERFDKAIAATQNVPNLERFVMEDLFWAETPLLESVGAREPWVCELRDKIRFVSTRFLFFYHSLRM